MKNRPDTIIFLGTAAAEGWPGLFCECEHCSNARASGGRNIRTRASVMIGEKYKVDFPPDTFMQMLREGLDLSKLEYLFITHEHADHFCLAELCWRFPPFAHIKDGRILNVYGNSIVAQAMEGVRDVMEKSNILVHCVKPFEIFDAGEMKVIPLPADHSPESLLYIFQFHGKSILYGNDSGWFPSQTWEEIGRYNLDIAILDCTNGPLPVEDRWHMGISGVMRAKENMEKMGIANSDTRFIATHFSHNGGLLYEDLCKKLNPAGITVAYDGLRIDL